MRELSLITRFLWEPKLGPRFQVRSGASSHDHFFYGILVRLFLRAFRSLNRTGKFIFFLFWLFSDCSAAFFLLRFRTRAALWLTHLFLRKTELLYNLLHRQSCSLIFYGELFEKLVLQLFVDFGWPVTFSLQYFCECGCIGPFLIDLFTWWDLLSWRNFIFLAGTLLRRCEIKWIFGGRWCCCLHL